jgi:uncharacterized protein YlzI (FlbEa/FlbD family)
MMINKSNFVISKIYECERKIPNGCTIIIYFVISKIYEYERKIDGCTKVIRVHVGSLNCY